MDIFDKIKRLVTHKIEYHDEIDDDYIVWNKNKPLQKSDFPQGFNLGESAVSATWKLIDADIQIISITKKVIKYKITKIKITAIFSRTQSWMDHTLEKYQDMDIVLHHEQKHFDIEEVYARKLQKKLDQKILHEFSCQKIDSKNSNDIIRKNVRDFLNDVRSDCQSTTNAFQRQYDDKVYPRPGHTDPSGQIEYDKKIEEMLQNSGL